LLPSLYEVLFVKHGSENNIRTRIEILCEQECGARDNAEWED